MIKVLFVTYDFPYPPNSGGKSRAFNMIKYGKEKDIEIHLLSFVRDDFRKEWKGELEKIGVKSINIFKRKKLKSPRTFSSNLFSKDSIFKTLYFDIGFSNLLKKIITDEKINIVHFESSYTGFYINKELRDLGVSQILGTENIEHVLYGEYLRTSKNPLKKAALLYQVERLKKEELKMMKEADICLAVTFDEARYIEKVTGKKCEVIENAISLKELIFKENHIIKNNLLFVGNFLYHPNIDAINYFQNNVMPQIDENIKLTVIGKKVNSVVKNSTRVLTKEFVPNLIDEYRNADALVFPVRIGGGTNFKVLEAMALGTPVIGFKDKISSIGAKNGEEFFAVDDAHGFVEKINMIINDKNNAVRITKNARKLIESKYSWEKVGRNLANVWKKVNYEKI